MFELLALSILSCVIGQLVEVTTVSTVVNRGVSLSCPDNNVITAGFSLQISDDNEGKSYTLLNDAACPIGQTTCGTTRIPLPTDAGMETLIWLLCGPESSIPPNRTAVSVTSNNGPVTATCPSGTSIVYGFSIHTSDQFNQAQDTCIPGNTQPCTVGASSCSTSFCSTAGDDFQFIYILCELPTDFPFYQLVSQTTDGSKGLLLTCPAGFQSAFGFTLQWSSYLYAPTCLDNTHSCNASTLTGNSNYNCTTRACQMDTTGSGGDIQFGVLACQAKTCGPPPNITNGFFACNSGGNGDLEYQAVCTFFCNTGYALSNFAYNYSTYNVTCGSNTSWIGVMPTCADINECKINNGGCDVLTTCNNTQGSRTCSNCPASYQGNGADPGGCQPVNRCTPTTCPASSQCVPVLGGYACSPVIRAPYYASPSDFSLINSVWQATNTLGGQKLMFNVDFRNASNVTYYFGYPNQPLSSLQKCQNTPILPTAFPRMNFSQSCTLPPSVGMNLTIRVYWCLPTFSGIAVCNWTQNLNSDKFQYPPPIIYQGTLQLYVGDPRALYHGQQPITARVTLNITDMPNGVQVYFEGQNFVNDPNKIAIFYGPASLPRVIACVMNTTATTSTVVQCAINENDSGNLQQFTVVVYAGDGVSGMAVTGHDTFSYSFAPTIDSVDVPYQACHFNDNVGLIECPTSGGDWLNLNGHGYYPPLTVLLGPNVCVVDQSSAVDFYLSCQIPPGVGTPINVQINSGGLLSDPKQFAPFLFYSAPSISGLAGCDPAQPTQTGVGGCLRTGGGAITLMGANFGASKATVQVAGVECTNVTHDATTPHLQLVAYLPPGDDVYLVVSVAQHNGAASSSSLTVSYAPCPAGTYPDLLSVACFTCPNGWYSDSSDAGLKGPVACQVCPAGRYGQGAGVSTCASCSAGTARNNTVVTRLSTLPIDTTSDVVTPLNTCNYCSPGTYMQSIGQLVCLSCPLGRFSNTSGTVECSECPAGQYTSVAGQTACNACPPGKSAENPGSYICDDCSGGFYSSTNGSTACIPCPSGTSQGNNGQANCTVCPIGSIQSLQGQQLCVPCDEGTYSNDPNRLECYPCPAGTVQQQQGQSACIACVPGYYQGSSGQQDCIPCAAGTATNHSGSIACSPCSPGTYAKDYGTKECAECADGDFSDTPGGVGCTQCDVGRYSVAGDKSTCAACPAGTFQGDVRSCGPCQPGQYSLEASVKCLPCVGNTVAPLPGTAICSPCVGSTASVDKNACDCPIGLYSVNATCVPCPVGARCTSVGTTLTNMETLAGWWRRPNNENQTGQLVFLTCIRVSDCVGGINSACGQFRTGPICSQCIPGYRVGNNAKCALCPKQGNAIGYSAALILLAIVLLAGMFALVLRSDKGRVMGGVSMANFAVRKEIAALAHVNGPKDELARPPTRKPTTSNLNAFESGSIGQTGSIGSIGSIGPVGGRKGPQPSMSLDQIEYMMDDEVSGLTKKLAKTEDPDQLRLRIEDQIKLAKSHVNTTFPLKVLLSFMQIATTLANISTIPWPTYYLTFIDAFSFLNINFIPWQTLSCSVSYFDFYVKLILTCLTPIGVVVCLIILFVIPSMIFCSAQREGEDSRAPRRRIINQFYKLMSFSLFLIYPMLSSTIFATFKCFSIEGVSYLLVDFTIVCHTSKWNKYAAFAAVMIVIYPIGIPSMFLFLLYYNRAKLYKDPGTFLALGFFYESFIPGKWWFEFFDMMHKLVLTSLLGFLKTGAQLQFGMAISVCYTALILLVSPFIRKSDDRLQLLTQAEIFSLMMAAYVLQNNGEMTYTLNVLSSAILIFIVIALALLVGLQMVIFFRKVYRLQARMRTKKQFQKKQNTANESGADLDDSGVKWEK